MPTFEPSLGTGEMGVFKPGVCVTKSVKYTDQAEQNEFDYIDYIYITLIPRKVLCAPLPTNLGPPPVTKTSTDLNATTTHTWPTCSRTSHKWDYTAFSITTQTYLLLTPLRTMVAVFRIPLMLVL